MKGKNTGILLFTLWGEYFVLYIRLILVFFSLEQSDRRVTNPGSDRETGFAK
jgi:hypothetical protein